MRLSQIDPFVRYVHFLDINERQRYGKTIPFDNRFFYLWSGTSKIRVEDTVYSVGEGDVLIIPSGTGYELFPSEGELRYFAVNFDYTQGNTDKSVPVEPVFSGKFDPRMRFENLTFSDADELNSALFVKKMNVLSPRLLTVEKEYNEKQIGFEGVTSSLITVIITECIRAHRAIKYEKSEKTVTEVLKYVEENFSAPLSADEIAAMFGFHPNYLSYLVKCYTGMPLHRYLMHVRISHAMDLLASGTVGVGEAAARCGFVDIYHFSKTFKKLSGVCPSKYL